MFITFKSKNIEHNTTNSFDDYSQRITKIVKRNQKINRLEFLNSIRDFGDRFEKENTPEIMNKKSIKLAQNLVSLKKEDLAGIIYSFLVKFNKDNYEKKEECAINALAIAIRLKDPIHIMARANDLKEIYKVTAKGSKKHLKTIYEEKRAIKKNIDDYERLKTNNRNIVRGLKSKENYQQMLAAIKIEIAELIMNENQNEAIFG